MKDRTHFSYRIDRWDDAGEYAVEHLASVEVAEATYWAAHQRWPGQTHLAEWSEGDRKELAVRHGS